MILSFKKQFVRPILDETKIHTLRQDLHDRWKTGNKIHFATGVRTPNYNQFKEGICKGVQRISFYNPAIEYGDGSIWEMGLRFIVDGKNVTEEIQKEIALNDGFDSLEDMLKWFNYSFIGKIIHWTDKLY